MDKFIKYGSFIISLVLLAAVLYDVYKNDQMRKEYQANEAARKAKEKCSCNGDHSGDGNQSTDQQRSYI